MLLKELGTKVSEFQAFELIINRCGFILLDFYLLKNYSRLFSKKDLLTFPNFELQNSPETRATKCLAERCKKFSIS